MKAEKGRRVSVHYKGMLDDGTVFDTSEGDEPLVFTMGAGEIIPGFEEALEGMEPGDKKTFTLSPEDAYGERHDEYMIEVPRGEFGSVDLEEGMMIELEDPAGRRVLAVIGAVGEDTVVVDLNHPLAGKTLTFEVEIVEVSEPGETPEPAG
ncbi:MAG: peptidylprolyl isomerase [Thermoplasmata archaeon]|nr:peptidylprolyl isomerase [Thermoplasmata archaeon]